MSVRDRFVKDVLESAGAKLLSRQGSAIASSVNQQSGRLMSGRKVTITGGGPDMSGKLTLEHPVYERFLDMKRPGKNGRKKRGRRIHNRFVFGAYASIAKNLMYGFTDEVASEIRQKCSDI